MANVLTKERGIIRTEFVPNRLIKLKNFANYVSTKQVAYDMEEIFRNDCNKYIPVSQGNIRDKGYKVTLSNNKAKPWYKLTYRNTSKLPYVMYQYIGHVWKPAHPLFEQTAEKFDPSVLKMRDLRIRYKHIGWYVPKNADYHETGVFFRRHQVNIKQKVGKHKFRTFHITGYTGNKHAQPQWVEYTQRHGSEWKTQTRVYVETTYASILERIANDERKRAERNAARRDARAYKKAVGDISRILGYTPGKIKTKLRKKKRT